jgi:hypothetical protein
LGKSSIRMSRRSRPQHCSCRTSRRTSASPTR